MRSLNRASKLLLAALLGTALATAPLAEDTSSTGASSHAEPKSGWVAYGAAAAGTLAPILVGGLIAGKATSDGVSGLGSALLLGGLVLGPSTGQFYAGSTTHGFLSSGIRTVGGLALVLGVANSMTSMTCMDREPEEPACDDDKSGAALLALLGAVTYGGGTLYSLVDTHRAVKRTRTSAGSAFGITPTLDLAAGGALRPGAMAWLRF